MERLPDELLLQIIQFISEKDLAIILAVSKRFRKIGLDNELWRQKCYYNSYSNILFRTSHQNTILPGSETSQISASPPSPEEDGSSNMLVEACTDKEQRNPHTDKLRAMANWDPSYPDENVNWYSEWIARHGPLSISWTEPIVSEDGYKLESRGLGLYRDYPGAAKVVSPLDDGTVSLWDIGHGSTHENERGRLIGRSKPGLLSISRESKQPSERAQLPGSGVVECVKIDSFRQKAYIAVQSRLSEVDLVTLQVSAYEGYPFTISALSSSDDNLPLTVGTTLSLHLHDYRQANNHWSEASHTTRVDSYASFPASPRQQNDFRRLLSGDDEPSDYAPLFQPGPLSIHHLTPQGLSPKEGEIYVAGRFPSVLVYDRRVFPRLRTNFFSGARLCCLTSLPYSFRALESELMRKQQLSLKAVQEEKSYPGDRLIACGEYNGKGALEIYGLSPDRCNIDYPPSQKAGVGQTSTFKNRVSASRSKLLSCVSHGTRILVSDSDGNLRWFERDGSSLVRSWNINSYTQSDSTNLFSTGYAPLSGDVARKLVPLIPESGMERIQDDELVIWTGERIGVLGFVPEPRFGGTNGEGWNVESMEDKLRHREERIYGETMKRALKHQADEVRMMKGLGFGL